MAPEQKHYISSNECHIIVDFKAMVAVYISVSMLCYPRYM